MLKQTEKLFRVTHGISYIFLSALLFIVTVCIGISLVVKPTITSLASAITEDPLSGLNNLAGDGEGGCSFTGTVTNAHSATISIGESSADFGTTKITTVCSNSLDHQVYAVGYSNETEGNTNLINTVDNTLTIPTGIEQGNISNWSMKISKDTSSYLPENLTLENNFNSNHVVPNESTLISSYTGGTDTTTGSSILTTYSANVANNQIAGNYAGVVKYTLTATTIYNVTIKTTEGIDKVTLNNVECTSAEGCVVPNLISGQSYTLEVTPTSGYEFTGWNTITSGTIADSTVTSTTYTIGEADETLEPEAERLTALLDTGPNVNKRIKDIANNTTSSMIVTDDTIVKSFRRSDTLPNDFVATTTNTISSTTSKVPIYIFFDNDNDAGIMYYYARDDAVIVVNSSASYMFYYFQSLSDISGVSNWETTNTVDMQGMFGYTEITNTDALATGKDGNPNIWNTENVTDMSTMFWNISTLTSISGLSNWDTSKVTSFNNMFRGASSLTDIAGLSNWNTANVTSMYCMFESTKITNVDALATGKNSNPNNWNTGSVTNMSSMFYNTSSLTDISGLANWDTANVIHMGEMFSGSGIRNTDALTTGKDGNPNVWNTKNVTSMLMMFRSTFALADISGLSNWDTSSLTDIRSMFEGAASITNVDALATGKNGNPNIWNVSKVTDLSSVFYGATSLTDISGLSNWDTSKVTNLYQLFRNTKITNVDALATGKNGNPNIWDTSKVTNMSYAFYYTPTLIDISGLSNWDTSKVTNISYMFYNTGITNVDALATGKNGNPNIWNVGGVTTVYSIFSYASSLTNVAGLSNWDTSNFFSLSGMFEGATSLSDISGVANWNTANVKSMERAFSGTKIANVDALSPAKNGDSNIWNTENVTNMKSMFNNTTSLTDISGLSNWDTAKVTSMSYMFYSTNITNVNALTTGKNNNPNIWNTAKVTDMSYMFQNASSLTDISGLANWNTAKVTDMSYMFQNASSLTDISGLANWNTAKVTKMPRMFYNDTAIIDISPIAGWDVSSVTATVGGTTSNNNKFYQMFYSVPSTVTSGFVFTNRAGTINSDGTYVPSS